MDEIIHNEIRSIAGDAGLNKARTVAARAVLLREFDPAIDMTSLIIGLYVGNDGEMPDSLHMGVIGRIHALALSQARSVAEEMDASDSDVGPAV